MQALEVLKYILGTGDLLSGRLVLFDALAFKMRELPFKKNTECAVCGRNPRITTLQADAETEVDSAVSKVARLSPRQLHSQLEQAAGTAAGSGLTVIDVREPGEFRAGHLAGAVNIPLGELPQRVGEIPIHSLAVFLCRGGGRSRQACELAIRAGLPQVADLDGGMLAWAALIDPTVTVAPFA